MDITMVPDLLAIFFPIWGPIAGGAIALWLWFE